MYLRGRACSAAAAAIDRYLLRTRAPPQQQTCWPTLLLSVDGTDSRFVTLTAYYTYVYRAVTLYYTYTFGHDNFHTTNKC